MLTLWNFQSTQTSHASTQDEIGDKNREYYIYVCFNSRGHTFKPMTERKFINLLLFLFLLFFNFTILYWFCHISKWIRHRYTCVPHPEPLSLLPPHTIPLGHPSAPAPSIQYRASNLDWRLVSYMILYIFQCHSPKSSHTLPLPQSPKDCSYKVKNHSALQFLDILPREKRKCVRSDFYTIAYSNIINNGKKVKKKKSNQRPSVGEWTHKFEYIYTAVYLLLRKQVISY